MTLVKIIKKDDDPICTRISAGGDENIGYYLVYRGEIKEVKKIINLLQEALNEDLSRN